MFRNRLLSVLKCLPRPVLRVNLCSSDNVKINRQIHCGICLRNPRHSPKANNQTSPALASKYQVITDDNSPIIENTAEEIHSEETQYPILSDEFDGINLQRKLLLKNIFLAQKTLN